MSSIQNRVLDIAHRGASGKKPENTKSAFIEALKLKADVIEFDIHRTKDNKLVVIHDHSIDRTSNGKGKVTSMTLEQLRTFNFGTLKHPEKIVTLQEALHLIGKQCRIIVELKDTVKGYETIVLENIEKAQNKHLIMVHSACLPILKKIRKLNSSIKLGYIVFFSYFHHFLYFYYKRIIRKYHLSFFSIDELFGNKFFVKNFIKELHNYGVNVFVWTVNDFAAMNQFMSWNVDGIITNYPGFLKEVIKESR